MTQATSAVQFVSDTVKRHLMSASIAKRTAVRIAIAEAIENGHFEAGERLPTERDLVEICGVSLGTVQAALTQLVNFDLIERKRGSGTIVKARGSQLKFGEHVWHFRFHSVASKKPLNIVASRMEIGSTTSRPDLKDILGDSESFTHIRRRFKMSEDVMVFSEMFLHPQTAPEIFTENTAELWVVNIRLYLEEEFGIKTTAATHTVSLVKRSEVPYETDETDAAAIWYKVTAQTFGPDGTPVYVQEIYARPDHCLPTFQTHSG